MRKLALPACSATRIFSPCFDQELLGLVIEQHRTIPSARKRRRPVRRHFRIFPDHQARTHFHLRHLRAEAGKGLGHFRADRPAAEDDQAARQLAQVPEVSDVR
jgi:hypothetical protein